MTDSPNWIQTLVSAIQRQTREDVYWQTILQEVKESDKTRCLHLAVFLEPYLSYILERRKTVESRFSINRVAPYGIVSEGDVIILKRSSGPVCGLCCIARVWNYRLTEPCINDIKESFSKQICIEDPNFWKAKATAKFATLMLISEVRSLQPFFIKKQDRRGWVRLSKF